VLNVSSAPGRPERPRRPLVELADHLGLPPADLRDPRGADAPPALVRRIEPDLARLGRGDLFVALPGAVVDGHDLVALAAMRGATAALVARSWADRLAAIPLPLLVVDDPASAVLRLAGSWRSRLRATVVGITGSVGKTSTKEAVAASVQPVRRTWATEANRNTALGVALTLLDAAATDEVVVLEIAGGGDHDEIAHTSALARPDIGVVTSVHPVHLATMGTIESIAASKADLVRAVAPDGAIVLNVDDPLVRAMAAVSQAPVRWYGRGQGADVMAESVRHRGLEGTDLVVRIGGSRHQVRLPFLGPHAVEVALAALTVADLLHVALETAIAGLPDAAPHLRPRLAQGVGGATIIDDAYSASPPSVRSALDLLGSLAGRRRIAVLGDMRELGALTRAAHEDVGRYAAHRVDLLVTVGSDARQLGTAASRERASLRVRSLPEDDVDDAVAVVLEELDEHAVVLVKGSRALRLERVVDALRREIDTATGQPQLSR